MVHNYKFTIAALLSLLPLAFTGCKQEQEGLAKAVLTNERFLTFAAKGGEAQTISVYCDGAWISDAPEWISLSPSSGSGPEEVKISVSDNYTGGIMDLPREGKIIFRGSSIERQGEVNVKQLGDTYKGVKEYSVTEAAALADNAVAKIPSAQVAAVTKKGFIITDGTTNVYALGVKDVKVGDIINLNGEKATDNDLPAFVVDELTVSSNSAVTYPSPKDVTSSIDAYKPDFREYISVSGYLVGNKLFIPGTSQKMLALDTPDDLGLAGVDIHKVVLKGYYAGLSASVKSLIVVSFEDKGLDESLVPYPLKFIIRQEGINFKTSFPAEGKIEAVQGLGYIEYLPFDLAHTDDNKKYKLDVSDNSPRCTGPWPGDYWLFYGIGSIKAGSEVRIAFEARTSATGHKFWRLEYLDGEVWKVAGEAKTTNEPGEEIIYTHAMAADGSTNIPVEAEVKFNKNVEHCQFRFICAANWQANGKGKLSTRNGGSARLSVTEPDNPNYQPHIELVKEGDGVEIPDTDPVYAKISVSETLLTFEGAPEGPKTFKVSSDYAYAVSTEADWLSLDVDSGSAGEEKTVTVTCTPSKLPTLREAVIKIVSESSKAEIIVVQSAAGQTLKPLLSIVGGNQAAVLDKAGTTRITVQANVEVKAVSDAPWLTISPVPTKSMVDELAFDITYEANTLEAERVAHIKFSNEKEKLESVLTVTQSGFSWFSDDFSWLQPYADKANAEDSVGDNNAGGKAPNVYTDDNAAGFLDKFAEKGYVDLNPGPKVMYLQKYYLKFGKTDYHSGIQLPSVDFQGDTPSDVVLKFNWCAHMTGKGNIDDVKIVVELSGAGICEGSEAAVSSPFVTSQTKGKLEWQSVSLKLKGVTKDTKIKIRPLNMGNAPKVQPTQQRWHIDNIKIVNP